MPGKRKPSGRSRDKEKFADLPRHTEADRRVTKATRLERVLWILRLVSGTQYWWPDRLAEEFDCSKKDIQRDVALIRQAGIDMRFDHVKRRYRLINGGIPGLPPADELSRPLSP